MNSYKLYCMSIGSIFSHFITIHLGKYFGFKLTSGDLGGRIMSLFNIDSSQIKGGALMNIVIFYFIILVISFLIKRVKGYTERNNRENLINELLEENKRTLRDTNELLENFKKKCLTGVKPLEAHHNCSHVDTHDPAIPSLFGDHLESDKRSLCAIDELGTDISTNGPRRRSICEHGDPELETL